MLTRKKGFPLFLFICAAAFFAALLTLAAPAVSSPSPNSQKNLYGGQALPLSSFREIPGVTDEEIRAVEAALASKDFFTYGMVESVEAFYRKDGSAGGLGINICDWLSSLFGVRFRPQIMTREELEDGLLDGSVDFSGDFTPVGNQADKYIMTDTIAERIIKYARLKGSQPLETLGRKGTARFGFMPHSVGEALTRPYLGDQIIRHTENDQDAILGKLRDGSLDVFIADSTIIDQFNVNPDIETGNFSPLLFKQVSLLTTNPRLKPMIDVLDKYLQQGGLHSLHQLRDKGHTEYYHMVFMESLNAVELAYYQDRIDSKQPVPYSIRSNNYPIGFYNEDEKQWNGIAVDVLKEISRITGLAFEPANDVDADFPEAFGMLERGEVPMITELLYTPNLEGRFIWSNEPYNTDRYALVSKRNFKNIGVDEILYSRVGLQENTGQMVKFQEWFPHHANVTVYAALQDALDALENDRIDLLMVSETRFLTVTNYMERSDFKINLMLDEALHSSFGFNLRETALHGVVSKAMALIDTESIASSWKYKVFDYGLKLTRTRNYFMALLSVLLLIILALCAWAYSRRREKEIFERAKLMYDSAPFGTVFWSKDQTILDCSQINVKLLGLKSKQEYMTRFFDLSPEYQPNDCRSQDMLMSYHKQAMSDGGPVTFEWMHQTANGEPRPCRMTLVRVLYNEEHTIIAYTEDLREHLKMIRQIEQNEQDLRAARDAAEASARGKSEFLARMSHEMRTPMNAITGFAELMLTEIEKRKCKSECLDWLGKLHNASMTLMSIINDILDISKIESGNFEIIPAEYDLPSLINDTVTLNMTRIGDKPIRFVLDIDDLLPSKLMGDDLRVKQICNNLLSNAFKYTMEGTVIWSVRSQRDADGESVWVTISVRDSGIGIREKDMKKLFSEYSQVDTKSNRRIEGTGLGLALTKKLAAMMDGSIDVESEYGKGSVFTVKIRQKYVTDIPIGPKVSECLRNFRYNDDRRLNRAHLSHVQLPYAKVLLVDDLRVNLEIAKGMMKPYGMQIDCVASGLEAIEAVREEKVRYSAIFMDHMMPEMDGMEATRIIRQEIGTEYARNVPVIVLTANAIVGNEEMFLANGFQAFLSKPIDVMRLDQVIRQWIRDKSMEESIGESIGESIEGHEGQSPSGGERASDTQGGNGQAVSRLGRWQIEGLDLAKAFHKLGSDEALLRVLQVFAEDTPALLEQMRSVTRENLVEYMVTVHGIKGSCRSISAMVLGDLAEDLEQAARANQFSYVEANNAAFIQAVKEMLAGVRQMLDAETAKTEKHAPDPAVLAALLDSAKRLDIDGMYDAMAELDRYEYETGGDLVKSLRENVRIMAFKKIIALVAQPLEPGSPAGV